MPDLVVVGAHLAGQPLNPQLLEAGGRLVGTVWTAPLYAMYALDTDPPKPGLLRVGRTGGAVTGEHWRLTAAGLGEFVASLVTPMTIGPVELADGRRLPGFLVEAWAVVGAPDITAYGSWPAYLDSAEGSRRPSLSSMR